jgi:FkbM family methyltransferase
MSFFSISITHIVRRTRAALRRQGIDVIPYNQNVCDNVVDAAIARHAIDTIIDVGANRGQFALSMFDYGFTGSVHSFEPLRAAYRDLAAASAQHTRWSSHDFALAASDGVSILNIGRNDETSSLQPLVDAAGFAATEVVGTEQVRLRRLDRVITDLGVDPARTFLKIDVQGSEIAVLQGAGDMLDRIPLIQIETSLRAIYAGESDFATMVGFFRERGFGVRGIRPVYFNPNSGEIMQVDLIGDRSIARDA